MRHHHPPTGWPQSRTLTPPNAGEDQKQQELSLSAGGRQGGTAALEDSVAGFIGLTTLLPHDPAVMLLD